MSANDNTRPFQLAESSGPGWCSMGLFGLCGWGHDRQSAWDDLRRQLNASVIRILETRVARSKT